MDEYEDEFEKRQCLYLLVAKEDKKLEKKLEALLRRNAEHATFANTLGVYCYNEGEEAARAAELFGIALRHAPDNTEAKNNLASLRASLKA